MPPRSGILCSGPIWQKRLLAVHPSLTAFYEIAADQSVIPRAALVQHNLVLAIGEKGELGILVSLAFGRALVGQH